MLRKTIQFVVTPSYSTFTNSVLRTSIKSCVCRSFHKDDVDILSEPILSDSIRKLNNRKNSQLGVLSLKIPKKLTPTPIQKMKSLEELMTYLQNNMKVDVPLYSTIFSKIYLLANSEKSFNKKQFIENPIFIQFCGNMNKSVNLIKPNGIIEILKTLVFLNVSTNSLLVQNLLIALSKCVDGLKLRQIYFVIRIFEECPENLVLDQLKLVLLSVFDTNVETQLDAKNPNAVIEALYFASKHKLSLKSQAIIINAALNLTKQFNLKHCKDIIIALCNMRLLDDEHKTLYSFCLAKVNTHMKKFVSFRDIKVLIKFTNNTFLFGNDSFFYDEKFRLNAVDYLIENNLGLSEAGELIRLLNRISFQNPKLLDYTSEIISNKNFDSENLKDISSFIIACSDASYKPTKWANNEEDLIQFFLESDVVTAPLYNVVVHLMVLDCWPEKLIEKVFDENFINHWTRIKNDRTFCAYFLGVYRAVKTLIPYNYSGPLPSTQIVEKCRKSLIPENTEINIRPALVKLLQDNENLVLDRVMTEFGHYLDHVIVVSKDGRPQLINLNNNVSDRKDVVHSLEGLKCPPNSHILGVILLPATDYCIDGIRLRGKVKMCLNSLSKIGVIPLPISLNIWDCLKDHEKLPYLRKELRAKVFLDDSFQV